ncbi:nuclear apoptosis-inducing factor 1-like [Asterias amurensis]|uniref:nuclear apoptosis-inducing factor 1-like n=1 Tax=Asterias amurensis TaxID=7602 RepID=UPI003AB7268B
MAATLKEKNVRKPNFSEKEKLLLLSEWEKRADVLRPKFSSKVTSQIKHEAWRQIAEALNSSFPSVRRDVPELQKKWQNMNSKMKEEASKYRKESVKTGGGPAPPDLSPMDQRLMTLIGENSPTIVGISGGIDSLPPDDNFEPAVAISAAHGSIADTPDDSTYAELPVTFGPSLSACRLSMVPTKRTRSEENEEEYGKLLKLEQRKCEVETRRAEIEIEKLLIEKEMIILNMAVLQQGLLNQ